MLTGKIFTQILRDGGLAAVMITAGIKKCFDNDVMNVSAVLCGVGAAIMAMSRLPYAADVFNGFGFSTKTPTLTWGRV